MNQPTRLTIRSLSLATVLAACCAGNAMAATATATSSSMVVVPIAVTKAADLSFGRLAAGASSGTVTVSPNGARSFSGSVAGVGGTISAAQFNVTGEPGLTYSITLGGSTQLTSGSDNLPFTTISDTSASSITSGNVSTGTLTGGAQSIYVGGSLAVSANQAPGNYSGTVTATVDYN